jgi:hypothetical protein
MGGGQGGGLAAHVIQVSGIRLVPFEVDQVEGALGVQERLGLNAAVGHAQERYFTFSRRVLIAGLLPWPGLLRVRCRLQRPLIISLLIAVITASEGESEDHRHGRYSGSG